MNPHPPTTAPTETPNASSAETAETAETDAKVKKIFAEWGPNNGQRFATMADFARTLERQRDEAREEASRYLAQMENNAATTLTELTALTRSRDELREEVERLRKAQPINTSLRLFDLVRYLRADLHQDGLITDSEYGWLCATAPMATSPKGGSPSCERLEEYDDMRQEIIVLTAQSAELRRALEEAELRFRQVAFKCVGNPLSQEEAQAVVAFCDVSQDKLRAALASTPATEG